MNETLAYKPLKLNNQPSAEQAIFIPKSTSENKKISSLYVTDLPFTADETVKVNLPIVGYRGINDQDSENLKILYPAFANLLKDKKVHTVVLVYNADVVDPKFKPGSETDLSRPLFNTYYAVKRFRDQLSSFDTDITLIFAAIKHQFYIEGLKTMDELVAKHGDKVLASLQKYKVKNNAFFDCINLTELSTNRLYDHLKLKDVISFYSYHSDRLRQYEFTFKSVRYCHNGDKLDKIQYTDAKLYLRVGPTYYKRIMIVNAHEEFEESLKPWAIGEIGRDYGKEFIKEIPRYDSFVNKPNNSGEYQRVITSSHNGVVSNLYNIYHPVDWEPVAGEWPNIERFLRHIFSACNLDGEVLYEFGLDYIQLSYQKPRQRLPIIALVSSERNTGKSTMLDFLKLIFGANMAILDNQRFNPKFTSHFAGKLFVAIDEGHIPLHDKTTKEMIKNMATGKVMWLEGKGANAEVVENFTHLMFCSNNERNFMQIDPGENRFAVLKVQSFRKQGKADDPDILEKMRAEIPAFLNFLQNRRLAYPTKTTRFWFPDHVYVTEALQIVMDRTKSTIEKELEDWLKDAFITFGEIELNYTLSDITNEMNKVSEYKFPKSKIKDMLAENYNITPGASLRYVYYSQDDKGELVFENRKGRYCTFYRQDWLTEDEILNYTKN
ncbi:MAG: primase-helicase family protein [Mangrovibacterium sp.]